MVFYSASVLVKKSTLGKVWLAAHWDKKLTKQQISQTDIIVSVNSIKNPETYLALRLSGHLLLGVTRIYSRQVKYLLADCSEALLKIKMVFRSEPIDLPTTASVANFNSITLPEVTTADFETLPDIISFDQISEEADVLGITGILHTAKRSDITRESFMSDDEMFVTGIQQTPEALRAGQQQTPSDRVSLGFGQEPYSPFHGGDLEPMVLEGRVSIEGLQNIEDFGVEPMGEDTFVPVSPIADITAPTITSIKVPSDADVIGKAQQELEDQIEPGRQSEAELPPRKFRRVEVTIDKSTMISGEVMKKNLADRTSITRDPRYTPSTNRDMARFGEYMNPVESLLDSPQFNPRECSRFISESFMTLLHPPQEKEVVPEKGVSEAIEEHRGAEFNADIGFEPPASPRVSEFVEPDLQQELSPLTSPSKFTTPARGEKEESVVDDSSWSEQTSRMMKYLDTTFTRQEQQSPRVSVVGDDGVVTEKPAPVELSFNSLVEKKTDRRLIAVSFFEMLVLQNKGFIQLQQDEPYGDIKIQKKPKFSQASVLATPMKA